MRKVIKGSWVIAAAIAGVVSTSALSHSPAAGLLADDGNDAAAASGRAR